MAKITSVCLLFAGFALAPAMHTASAAPANGWSLYGGLASHSTSGKFVQGFASRTSFEIESSGLSIGGDYQFEMNKNFSLNIIFMTSSESASSERLIIDTSSHQILGLQGRIWAKEVFFGAQIGRYSEIVSDSKSGSSVLLAGTGYGMVVGWEAKSGLFFSGQFDFAVVSSADAESNLAGLRIHVGFRWK